MKKFFLLAVSVAMLTACGFTKGASSNAASGSTSQTAVTATSAGQGAGNAMLNLYNQYKADGNKYDYTNLQNAMNTVMLISSCEGLAKNYKDQAYRQEFGQGMIASSLGLVTQSNVESVTNSLVDMVKESEQTQEAKSKAQQGASKAADYVGTAAVYAGAISSLLSAFSQ
jgi:hypothetical protein